jgi:hypothetical protein
MFILFSSNNIDDESRKNPLKALVKVIEQEKQLFKQAEELFYQQSEAMNLKLKDKIRETTLALMNVEYKIANSQVSEMQLIDLLPIDYNPLLN